jgi:hypothetical protein
LDVLKVLEYLVTVRPIDVYWPNGYKIFQQKRDSTRVRFLKVQHTRSIFACAALQPLLHLIPSVALRDALKAGIQ